MGAIRSDAELSELVSKVVRTNPDMIFTFKPKFLVIEDWESAINANPAIFARCKNKTPNLCMIAVSLDGFNMEYIDPAEHTESFYLQLCKTAISQNPKAIAAIPKEFRTKELRAMAYAKDPELMMNEKKLSQSMIEAILDHNPGMIRDVVDPSDDMIIRALSKDPRVIVYFKSISPRVKDFFEEYYPQYAAMLIHD